MTEDYSLEYDTNGSEYSYYDYYYDYEEEEGVGALIILGFIVAGIGLCANAFGLLSICFMSERNRECSEARIRLLISLGAADMFICLSLFLYDLIMPTLARDGDYCAKVLLGALLPTAQVICLLNLLGMAIDHYIAILNPLRYGQLMNSRRATIMISVFWFVTALLAFADFASGLDYDPNNKGNKTYCEHVANSVSYDPEFSLLVIAFICLVGMSYIYSRIYDEIRKIAKRGPPNQNFNQVRRGLITTWLILGSFLVCWLPFFVAHMAVILMASLMKLGYEVNLDVFQAFVDAEILEWLVPLFMLNTVLDPAIYVLHLINVKRLCQFTRGARRGSYFDTADETRKTTTCTVSTAASTCGQSEGTAPVSPTLVREPTAEQKPLRGEEDMHYV